MSFSGSSLDHAYHDVCFHLHKSLLNPEALSSEAVSAWLLISKLLPLCYVEASGVACVACFLVLNIFRVVCLVLSSMEPW